MQTPYPVGPSNKNIVQSLGDRVMNIKLISVGIWFHNLKHMAVAILESTFWTATLVYVCISFETLWPASHHIPAFPGQALRYETICLLRHACLHNGMSRPELEHILEVPRLFTTNGTVTDSEADCRIERDARFSPIP